MTDYAQLRCLKSFFLRERGRKKGKVGDRQRGGGREEEEDEEVEEEGRTVCKGQRLTLVVFLSCSPSYL